ncbi:MAG: BREX-1 system phosphatase PglZ type B [Planctomycetales bacterium]|nr:BREX-1 system phosphatase PglZ type B [Planctomycetales bacterium]
MSNLLDSIIIGLDASTRCARSEVAPTAVLWTDTKSEWLPLLEQLKARLPQLLVLGEYAPDTRTGPAIWLKCAMQGVLPEVDFPKGKTPILYLPGVGRQELRAGTQCPWELQPLVELLYRGTVWAQKNGRDWTVEAMLVSKESPALGLDVSGTANTKLSMMASLAVLAITPVSKLEGRRLEAEDFDRLMIGDHPRDLLRWMSNPQEVRAEMDEGKWHAFCNRCRDEYGFDPNTDGEIVAGEKLGLQETSSWETLWSRFREAPATYSGVATTLRKAKPQSRLRFEREYWPDENEQDEDTLRKALLDLATVDQGSARTEIAKLEQHHGVRRSWVWAKLGQAPMACALEFLVGLANRTASHLGGDSIADLEKQYVQGGYLADDFALKALASVKAKADCDAIEAAVRALYLPWLEHAAERFQDCVQKESWPNRASSNRPPTVKAEVGTCLLFADGLRYDLAVRLTELLRERGYTTDENRRWAALPSVTSTAKPAVSPIAEKLEGRGLPDSFTPEIVDAGESKPLTHARSQSLLKTEGYQIISASEVGDPAKPKARGWVETGEIDKRGHDLQIKLASLVAGQVEALADRIVELLGAGWRKVRVITDHGWLLMPGGLPKQELPSFLTEAKWSRCATIKGESKPDVDRHSWYWNSQAEFASASGIKCFSAGHCYQHGGVSLQECLVADILVSPDVQVTAQSANIAKVDWKGLKCRITVEPVVSGLQVDLRNKPNDPTTSITSGGKALDGNGTVTLFVEDEDLEGSVVAAVVCSEAGQVLAKQSTTVGGE